MRAATSERIIWASALVISICFLAAKAASLRSDPRFAELLRRAGLLQ